MKKQFSKYFAPSLKDARKRIKIVKNVEFVIEDKYQGLGINKTYMVKTYGCQGNLRDSEVIAGILEKIGYVVTDSELDADIIILNTCCVRENAEKKLER